MCLLQSLAAATCDHLTKDVELLHQLSSDSALTMSLADGLLDAYMPRLVREAKGNAASISAKIASTGGDPLRTCSRSSTVDWPLPWLVANGIASAVDSVADRIRTMPILPSRMKARSLWEGLAAAELLAPHLSALQTALQSHMGRLVSRALSVEERRDVACLQQTLPAMTATGREPILGSCATVLASLRLHAMDALFTHLPALNQPLADSLYDAVAALSAHLIAVSSDVISSNPDRRTATLPTRVLCALLASARGISCFLDSLADSRPQIAAVSSFQASRSEIARTAEALRGELCQTHAGLCVMGALAEGPQAREGVSANLLHMALLVSGARAELRQHAPGEWRSILLCVLGRALLSVIGARWVHGRRVRPLDPQRQKADLVFLLCVISVHCPAAIERFASHGDSPDAGANAAERDGLAGVGLCLLSLLALCAPAGLVEQARGWQAAAAAEVVAAGSHEGWPLLARRALQDCPTSLAGAVSSLTAVGRADASAGRSSPSNPEVDFAAHACLAEHAVRCAVDWDALLHSLPPVGTEASLLNAARRQHPRAEGGAL